MTTPQEPKGVVIADGEKLRTDKVFRIYEDGHWRELQLRVARGVIRDVTNRREPRPGREI
jgi:hypothetical protein